MNVRWRVAEFMHIAMLLLKCYWFFLGGFYTVDCNWWIYYENKVEKMFLACSCRLLRCFLVCILLWCSEVFKGVSAHSIVFTKVFWIIVRWFLVMDGFYFFFADNILGCLGTFFLHCYVVMIFANVVASVIYGFSHFWIVPLIQGIFHHLCYPKGLITRSSLIIFLIIISHF